MKESKLTMRELYETDFALWLEQTAILLQKQDFQHLDLPNLIEEVESLGRSDKRELYNRLTTLFEHSLKRCFTDLIQDYRGWTDTIRRNQKEIKKLLEDVPSLKIYVQQIIDECYQDALLLLKENPDYQSYPFPEICPFPTDSEQLLNDIFWE
ncbi:hypothetical protein GlitD10_2278 [Gloeomargarita lithophora Alchichica-D10]|uniref:DUF29 domain-containing protein n=1 Tax=Gloeomargarita lithophora Alchichica-D10 TaxID=1188229 RepID=A0A1J0AF99_9CYAN|nr:DUF29 domain-containing protein [Gloeomargarita lithophora]APB34610.1 hypothetical protein GlitD10_2278 [Gloeomargarita lithophora Alchichica-D10]